MAKDETGFQKLLSEAPMAPSADTITVVGILSRTADAARFNLTLADGRSVTLDVNAVKSAKEIAGAIGQKVVQLELDAKLVPGQIGQFQAGSGTPWYQDTAHLTLPNFDATGILDLSGLGDVVSFPPGWGGFANLGGAAPFVAAMPHQADPRTMMALGQLTTTTYFSVIPNLDVGADPQKPPPKAWKDPQSDQQ